MFYTFKSPCFPPVSFSLSEQRVILRCNRPIYYTTHGQVSLRFFQPHPLQHLLVARRTPNEDRSTYGNQAD